MKKEEGTFKAFLIDSSHELKEIEPKIKQSQADVLGKPHKWFDFFPACYGGLLQKYSGVCG
ncbi:hypothetical protein HN709_01330 [Candidatus Peregrinibacteria bacterium]|nr:hypothetical protein [Candidatus Peregrinibacteria bacterium]MBT7736306.1 hypothetical protein [Candidatus Peregrinibacteria bacterium]